MSPDSVVPSLSVVSVLSVTVVSVSEEDVVGGDSVDSVVSVDSVGSVVSVVSVFVVSVPVDSVDSDESVAVVSVGSIVVAIELSLAVDSVISLAAGSDESVDCLVSSDSVSENKWRKYVKQQRSSFALPSSDINVNKKVMHLENTLATKIHFT